MTEKRFCDRCEKEISKNKWNKYHLETEVDMDGGYSHNTLSHEYCSIDCLKEAILGNIKHVSDIAYDGRIEVKIKW